MKFTMMAADNSEVIVQRLEQVKDIKDKTVELEVTREKLREALDIYAREQNSSKEYKSELELLMQEKMAHVEELRLIHADINMMETMIKNSDHDGEQAMTKAKGLLDDYQRLKRSVDRMRTGLGLNQLDDFSLDWQDGGCSVENLVEASETVDWKRVPPVSLLGPGGPPPPPPPTSSTSGNTPTTTAVAAAAPPPTLRQPLATQPTSQMAALPQQLSQSLGPPPPPGPPAFRQQPPPMKSCMSCHQQIHRNAPICPLCKAKSRSRNPKKPKRKLDE